MIGQAYKSRLQYKLLSMQVCACRQGRTGTQLHAIAFGHAPCPQCLYARMPKVLSATCSVLATTTDCTSCASHCLYRLQYEALKEVFEAASAAFDEETENQTYTKVLWQYHVSIPWCSTLLASTATTAAASERPCPSAAKPWPPPC